MPGPATAATLAAVRRAWAEGSTVKVVSFRTGAADLSVPVAGPLAGRRLEQVRRHFGGPSRLVLGLQLGVPFSDLRQAQQVATTAGLVVAMRRFKRVTLIVSEDPGLMPVCFRAMVRFAGECIATSEALRQGLEERYHLRPETVVVEEPEPYPTCPPGCDPASLGLYGPGAGRGLTVVELPTTTVAQRAKARGRLTKSKVLRVLRAR
jgi:hypothetical protein